MKAVAVEGNQLPLREYKNAAKMSKAAGANISEDFWTEIFPTFAQSEGGARFGTQIGKRIHGLIKRAGLGATDRLLGAAFGLVRGVTIVTVGVLLAGLTALPGTPAWRQAMTRAPLEMLAKAVKVGLPYDLAKRSKYG